MSGMHMHLAQTSGIHRAYAGSTTRLYSDQLYTTPSTTRSCQANGGAPTSSGDPRAIVVAVFVWPPAPGHVSEDRWMRVGSRVGENGVARTFAGTNAPSLVPSISSHPTRL